MAKLFNNIRKKLVAEKPSVSRTSNYLKYAIGEIVLVVIGILIAVQINNWNEDRKDRILEKEYLTRLLEDLKFDISWGNTYILDRYKRKVEGLEKGKAYYQGNYVIKDTLQFLRDIGYGGVFGYASLNLNKNTYNELISTGNLRKIESDKLRNEIVNYYENSNAKSKGSKDYISGYINFINSFTAFNTNNKGIIAEFDQKLLLKHIKTEEYYRLANLELTLAHRVSSFTEDIINFAKRLTNTINTQLED
ncbi:MAG: DUF6090 family protein [Flavobacteriaceae bacterium]|nr:DUF6090 family protein [Flavobacteriaceae bacterium]